MPARPFSNDVPELHGGEPGIYGIAGIGSISTSLVLPGYIADYYPAATRATATGWALSFARIGAISGPIIGGWIAAWGAPFERNFAVFAIIGLVAAGAVAMISRRVPQLDGTAAAAAGAAASPADASKQTEPPYDREQFRYLGGHTCS
ncbi:MFS transporter [Arthrobacter gengyunqii]|uniref:MFS transporter n=1 Tax=Arthrobacter gengyunqii TaxID=2886940 RepID=UPI00311AB6F0